MKTNLANPSSPTAAPESGPSQALPARAYTLEQVADLLNVSYSEARDLVSSGELSTLQEPPGLPPLVPESELLRYLRQRVERKNGRERGADDTIAVEFSPGEASEVTSILESMFQDLSRLERGEKEGDDLAGYLIRECQAGRVSSVSTDEIGAYLKLHKAWRRGGREGSGNTPKA